MAVSSVSSSSSIYGNRNVITGLASGMDTESMIENAISAYKNKITALTQKRTKTEWKQEAYQSMINKMSAFSEKYTSYRSSSNLMSNSFFDSAVKTISKGAYADKITATGRSSNDIQVNRVRQLATAATYKLSGKALDAGTANFGDANISAAASGTLDLGAKRELSTFSGELTLAYGGQNSLSYLTINFDETKTYDDAYDLAEEINNQLKTQTVTIGNKSYTGEDLLNNVVRADFDNNGNITFVDPKNNNVYISRASSSVKEMLLGDKDIKLSSDYSEQVKTLNASGIESMRKETTNGDYLANSTISITLDGVTKSIKLPTARLKDDAGIELTPEARDKDFIDTLQNHIDAAFGKGRVTVSDANGGEEGIKLQFATAQKGSSFSVSSSKGEVLGFGETGQITSYLNTNRTLGDLLAAKGVSFSEFEKAYEVDEDGYYVYETDANGKYVLDENGDPKRKEKTDANGNPLYIFRVNGKDIGQFNENTTLSTVINTMNSNSECGVKVAYSKLTNELTFTAKDTGAASDINFNNPDSNLIEGKSLSAALFGVPKSSDGSQGTFTAGQDAILEVSVNGTSLGEITRSTNSVELDGLTINLKGTFGYEANEDGSVKYNTSYGMKDGHILFTGGNGKEIYGDEQDDGTVKLTSKGIDLTYKPSAGDANSYNNSAIYGKFDKDTGKLNFYMKDKDGNNEKQVYLQQGGWFSTTEKFGGKDPVEFQTTVTKTPVQSANTEPVTFETTSDADKIVNVVKEMVEEYNAMVTEIKKAYSTLPAQRSNGAYYEPLTEEDEEGMTESAIKNWEEKARQGILFGDRDLANLYTRLTSAVSLTGENGAALRAAGITVNYSNGLSTLSFDEDKFRTALNDDPEKVRDAFTASTENGAKSNGLMQALKQPLDMYGKTSGGKGILVEKAGSPLAPSTMYTNVIQKELDRIDEEIEKWQDKMSDQVDRYTSQFSRLEQLIQQMNSQSSYFSQLMGG